MRHLSVVRTTAVRWCRVDGRLGHRFNCIRCDIARAIPQSERFDVRSNVFGCSDVASSGGHHRTDTDGRYSILDTVKCESATPDAYWKVHQLGLHLDENRLYCMVHY